ncbi:MAG: LamG domain-containing protein [Phycisphaerales bacterium]|nr:MAG: LamG domain-containing protein [Phycisphaerales bacterium]
MCGRFFLSIALFVALAAAGGARADLVSHHKLDEGGGTSAYEEIAGVSDEITHESGPVTWATPGGIPARPLLGNALNFDVTDKQFIQSTVPAGLEDGLSFAFWVRPTGAAIDPTPGGINGCTFYLRNNKPRWYVRMSNGLVLNQELSTPLASDTWSHIVFTFEPTSGEYEAMAAVKIYINGELAGWQGTNFAANLNTPTKYAIGKHPAASADYFNGALDDVRLYDTALTAADVGDLYNVGFYVDPLEASNPHPYYDATGVNIRTVLSWTAGSAATHSDVYFGTDFDDVNEAADPNTLPGRGRQDTNTYDPGILEFGRTYYWRVDGVNATEVRKGNVWSFTAGDSLIVDDFEGYGDGNVPGEPGGRVWYTWNDGEGWTDASPSYEGNGTGSLVDLSTDPALGKQALAYYYDNDGTNYLGTSGKQYYSEAAASTADLASGSDWTLADVKLLSLQFHGHPDNDANATEQMYVRLKDDQGQVAEIPHPNPGAIQTGAWRVWEIQLQDFVQINNALSLAKISEITIGFGDKNSAIPGGSGVVYFDNIGLFPARCESPPAQGDVNGDCVVDFRDCALLFNSWLESGLWP